MIRPMTSNVSAFSGGVANGHKAIHLVSSVLSKISHGGFSQVICGARHAGEIRPFGSMRGERVGHWPLAFQANRDCLLNEKAIAPANDPTPTRCFTVDN